MIIAAALVLLTSTESAAQRMNLVEAAAKDATDAITLDMDRATDGVGPAAFIVGGAILGGIAGYVVVQPIRHEEYAYPVLMPAGVVLGALTGALGGWLLQRAVF